MNKSSLTLQAVLSFVLLAPVVTFAGLNYTDSLSAADAAMGSQKADLALQEIETALTQSVNAGERGLAMAKKGYVLAFMKTDYAGGRAAASEALLTPDLAPVAKVTALQVLAQCQMSADKDYAGALQNLKAALELQGVEWARPPLTLALADCHRSTGQLDQALSTYQSVIGMASATADVKAGAYLNIGFIYQYDRRDAAKAKEAYAQAVTLRPGLQSEVNGHISRLATP